MEWQQTTFGELKAGDVFLTSESEDRGGYDIVFLRLGTAADVEEHWGGVNREVYRLVSPEREALEKATNHWLDDCVKKHTTVFGCAAYADSDVGKAALALNGRHRMLRVGLYPDFPESKILVLPRCIICQQPMDDIAYKMPNSESVACKVCVKDNPLKLESINAPTHLYAIAKEALEGK